MEHPLVSVIILNYNGVEHLPTCIESLLAQDYPNIEIIIADNGSRDNSREVCERYPKVKFAALGYNYGFGKGNNKGAKRAKGKYLFFVNNDMRFAPDVVSKLVEIAEAERDGKIFALDIKQYNWEETKVIHSAVRLKRSLDPRAMFIPFIDCIQFDVPDIVSVPFVSGANFFCRRDMFEQLGGFDPTFFIDHEDVDLGWRACLRGWRILYVPQAVCWHKVGMSGETSDDTKRQWTPWGRKRYFSGQRNKIRFVMKTMDWKVNLLTFFAYHFLALIYLFAGRFFQTKVMMKAYWINILRFPEVLQLRLVALKGARYNSRELIRQFMVNKL